MNIQYKNDTLEKVITAINLFAATAVVATFVALHGFHTPLLPRIVIHIVQMAALAVFVIEKILRFYNALRKKAFFAANWFEIPLLIILAGFLVSEISTSAKILTVGIYLIAQVVMKICRACVHLAASGQNPTRALVSSFLILIIVGAGLLMLPKSYNTQKMSFVDALFTATSATCVTGLIVKDTGQDFTIMGQLVILTLIQLGGLGIVIFGVVMALLLRQALSVKESVAMQDLLSTQTLGRISNMIVFIFTATIIIEAIGAVSMFGMWTTTAGRFDQWFCPVFHSISAFCNAGFSLSSDSLIGYSKTSRIYSILVPLIILGGLGFGVLYNLASIVFDWVKRVFRTLLKPSTVFEASLPVKLQLQTKIVLTTSLVLIVLGAFVIIILEKNRINFADALFQSITARTAGFNTVDIASMSAAGKLVLITLMFIGGSSGSTAGGIKTVTLTVIIMLTIATLRKRHEVEIFKRSIRPATVARAITVTLLFATVLLTAILLLSITENNNFSLDDIMFEAASALGTVGLSTGITPHLTTAGKLIIIITMLIGRLGPLTLLAAMTFNLKTARYSYPSEPIIVG